MPFLMHGEDVRSRDRYLRSRGAVSIEPLSVEVGEAVSPACRMILEHLSSKDGVDFVNEARPPQVRRHDHAPTT